MEWWVSWQVIGLAFSTSFWKISPKTETCDVSANLNGFSQADAAIQTLPVFGLFS